MPENIGFREVGHRGERPHPRRSETALNGWWPAPRLRKQSRRYWTAIVTTFAASLSALSTSGTAFPVGTPAGIFAFTW